jgi:hypothetical protein
MECLFTSTRDNCNKLAVSMKGRELLAWLRDNWIMKRCCVPWSKLVDDQLIDGEKIPEASWRNLWEPVMWRVCIIFCLSYCRDFASCYVNYLLITV